MTTADASIQDRDEVAAILALLLASTDERLTTFNSLGEADKAIVCAQASADLDQVVWEGRKSDPDQAHAWPRLDRACATILPGGEMDLPGGIAAWSTPSVPAGVRRAHAIQAARRAVEARGFSRARQTRDDAHAGITGRSGLGTSVTIDAARMRSPIGALDPDAYRHASRFIRRTANLA